MSNWSLSNLLWVWLSFFFFLWFIYKSIIFSAYGVGHWMFSLNDCLWISEDEASKFEEQQSKTKKHFSGDVSLGDWMLSLNVYLCVYYCPIALFLHMRFRWVHLQDKSCFFRMYLIAFKHTYKWNKCFFLHLVLSGICNFIFLPVVFYFSEMFKRKEKLIIRVIL